MNPDELLNEIINKNPIFPEYKRIEETMNKKLFVRQFVTQISGKILFVSESSEDINEVVISNGLYDSDYEIVEELGVFSKTLSEYDVIVYISYTNREKWIAYFREKVNDVRVIDLYEELEFGGYVCNQEYYNRHAIKRDAYANLNKIKQQMKVDKNNEKHYLQQLIYIYLEIRDFVYAFKYMDEYIVKKYDGYENVCNLKNDIAEMLSSLKNFLSNQNLDSIIMVWIDSVQYDEMKEMSFLRKEMENSLCFDNAYTVTPFTIPTYFSLFCQKKSVTNQYHTYKKQMITEENSSVMRRLANNGYTFLHHGVAVGLFKYDNCAYGELKQLEFDDDSIVRKKMNIRKYKSYDYVEDVCPMVLWKGLCDLATGEKVFSLNHVVIETHTPYVSGNYEGDYLRDYYNPNLSQIDKAREYVDQQMEFYSDIWGENINSILMSDHGKYVKLSSGKTLNDMTHTFFMIKGKNIEKRHFSGMFSYVDFYKVIDLIIDKDTRNIESISCDYVTIEDLDRYGVLVVPLVGDDVMTYQKKALLGYRGIRTKNDCFIKRSDGKKYYYNNNSKLNLYGLVDKVLYEGLESMVPDYDIDMSDNMYTYTKVLLNAIKHHDMRIYEEQYAASILLNRLFKEIKEEDIVAFRPGGETTFEIMRQHGIKSKVNYIIDNNIIKEEELGIEYILPKEVQEHSITKIFITSYNHHLLMSKELSEMKNIEVIDIYDYFEQNGISLSEDYLSDKISSYDIKKIYDESNK